MNIEKAKDFIDKRLKILKNNLPFYEDIDERGTANGIRDEIDSLETILQYLK